MTEENKLNYGDKQFIAKSLKCSQVAVDLISKGSRAKRNTPLQKAVKEAITFRERQNDEMERFCKMKRMDIIK